MKKLEQLSKRGWRFAIWLIPGGSCIIQGCKNDSDDWDIDIAAATLDNCIKQVLFAISKLSD